MYSWCLNVTVTLIFLMAELWFLDTSVRQLTHSDLFICARMPFVFFWWAAMTGDTILFWVGSWQCLDTSAQKLTG